MPSVQINLNGQSPDRVLEKLQIDFDHHGIEGLALDSVQDNPELRTLRWKERQNGIAGVLNRVVGAEEERVLASIGKSGAEVVSEVVADAHSSGLNNSVLSKALRAGIGRGPKEGRGA